MAPKRGGSDGGKPAVATEGVAAVPPQEQATQTAQAPVGDEALPELTRAAYEAVITANTGLSRQLADALGAVNELNAMVAGLTSKLDEAVGREKAALGVIDRLTATASELANQIEAQAVPAPRIDPDEKGAVANLFGIGRDQVLSFAARVGRVTVVTIDGRKLVKDL